MGNAGFNSLRGAYAFVLLSALIASGCKREPALWIAQTESQGIALDFQHEGPFRTNPLGRAIRAGTETTIEFAHCPMGVSGSAMGHSLLLGNDSSKEVVLITGGSCDGSVGHGTLRFTSSRSHGEGAYLTSATAGIQEAGNLRLRGGGHLTLTLPTYKVYAPIHFNGGEGDRLIVQLGPATTIEFPNDMDGDGITFSGTLGGAHLGESGVMGGKLKTTSGFIDGSLIVFQAVSRARVEGVELSGASQAAIRLIRAPDATITGNTIAHDFYGVLSTSSIAGEASDRAVIRNNLFQDNLSATGVAIYSTSYGAGWEIEDNRFESLVGRTIVAHANNSNWSITQNSCSSVASFLTSGGASGFFVQNNAGCP